MDKIAMLEDINDWADTRSGSIYVQSGDSLDTDDLCIRINRMLEDSNEYIQMNSVTSKKEKNGMVRVDFKSSAHWCTVVCNESELNELYGDVTHERYRLSAIEQAIGDDLVDELLGGIMKPWQKPIAYMFDGSNIVLFRCRHIEEDFIQYHPGEYSYEIDKRGGCDIPILHYNGAPVYKHLSSTNNK